MPIIQFEAVGYILASFEKKEGNIVPYENGKINDILKKIVKMNKKPNFLDYLCDIYVIS